MSEKFKIGDKIRCYKSCELGSGRIATTVNKTYYIIGTDYYNITILNDQGVRHIFNTSDINSYAYYKNWFDSIRDERKMKLNNIKNNDK